MIYDAYIYIIYLYLTKFIDKAQSVTMEQQTMSSYLFLCMHPSCDIMVSMAATFLHASAVSCGYYTEIDFIKEPTAGHI